MMTKKPRILLVGAGGYGGVYLRALTRDDAAATLAGICDIRADVRPDGIPVYPTVEAFYEKDTADLAIIVAPVHFHLPMTLTCLAHGTNVLCEKPLCMTVEEADTMSEAAKKAGRFVSLGYQLNYRRDVLALKDDILTGKFGRPKRLAVYHCYRRGARYYARNDWAGHIHVGGREVFDSPFTNACAHNFQMMTFLLGDAPRTACAIADVQGELYHGNPVVENYDIAALRFLTPQGVPLLYYTAHTLKTETLGPVGRFEFEGGVVTFAGEGSSFRATLADGSTIDYGAVDPGTPMQKLDDAIACVLHGGAPVCGIEADLAHIQAVRMAQALPIRQVRQALRRTMDVDGDTVLYVDGLEDVFAASARAWALPSEIGLGLGD